MPAYSFRLEAPDGSGHFRVGTIYTDTEEEARALLEFREHRRAAFKMNEDQEAEVLANAGVDSIDDLPERADIGAPPEDSAAFRALPAAHRAWVATHRQAQPFDLVSLEEAE